MHAQLNRNGFSVVEKKRLFAIGHGGLSNVNVSRRNWPRKVTVAAAEIVYSVRRVTSSRDLYFCSFFLPKSLAIFSVKKPSQTRMLSAVFCFIIIYDVRNNNVKNPIPHSPVFPSPTLPSSCTRSRPALNGDSRTTAYTRPPPPWSVKSSRK